MQRTTEAPGARLPSAPAVYMATSAPSLSEMATVPAVRLFPGLVVVAVNAAKTPNEATIAATMTTTRVRRSFVWLDILASPSPPRRDPDVVISLGSRRLSRDL